MTPNSTMRTQSDPIRFRDSTRGAHNESISWKREWERGTAPWVMPEMKSYRAAARDTPAENLKNISRVFFFFSLCIFPIQALRELELELLIMMKFHTQKLFSVCVKKFPRIQAECIFDEQPSPKCKS